jgi:hypothetical protein
MSVARKSYKGNGRGANGLRWARERMPCRVPVARCWRGSAARGLNRHPGAWPWLHVFPIFAQLVLFRQCGKESWARCHAASRAFAGDGLPTVSQVLFSCFPPDFSKRFVQPERRVELLVECREPGRVWARRAGPANAGLSPPTSPAARLLCCQSSTVSCDKSWRSSSPVL